MTLTNSFGFHRFGLSVLVSAMLVACGGGTVSGTATVAPPAAAVADGPTVTGTVIAGPVDGSKMEFFEVESDGKNGEKLGSGITDSSGSYRITLSRTIKTGKGLRGIATGGSYTSEADTKSAKKTLGTLETLIPSPAADKPLAANVTPLTHFASVRATELAGSG